MEYAPHYWLLRVDMSRLSKFDFNYKALQDLQQYQFGNNWPVVYIIENGKVAYIGETTSAIRRMKNHLDDQKRRSLTKINVITDNEFNKSVSLDLESMLIEYIAADGKYLLQNGNKGLKDHNYYDRDKYNSRFNEIWNELKTNNIAVNSLFDIRNSDLFKLSPYKVLTEDQLDIVNNIEEIMTTNEESINVIKGEPGSGKTILAVYLAKYFVSHEDKPLSKIGIVLPMTSLRGTVKKVFKHVDGLKSSMVYGPSQVVQSGEKFDLLIVDEAHRLAQRRNLSSYTFFDDTNEKLGLNKETGTQLDWILKSAKHVILFYDKNQSVKPSDINPEQFSSLNANLFTLRTQMRVRAGNEYPEYIEKIMKSKKPNKLLFSNYELRLFEDVQLMIDEIKEKDKKYGLSRVVAGYAWEWKSRDNSEIFDIQIGSYMYRWNSINTDWINSSKALDEVGCIHTVQGYDLNYVGVIIGPELIYKNGKILFVKEQYKDRYGKHNSKSDEDTLNYIINIYKTLMTRGILGTFVYVCDDGLREYLKNYF